jgi:hypothetical protein
VVITTAPAQGRGCFARRVGIEVAHVTYAVLSAARRGGNFIRPPRFSNVTRAVCGSRPFAPIKHAGEEFAIACRREVSHGCARAGRTPSTGPSQFLFKCQSAVCTRDFVSRALPIALGPTEICGAPRPPSAPSGLLVSLDIFWGW